MKKFDLSSGQVEQLAAIHEYIQEFDHNGTKLRGKATIFIKENTKIQKDKKGRQNKQENFEE